MPTEIEQKLSDDFYERNDIKMTTEQQKAKPSYQEVFDWLLENTGKTFVDSELVDLINVVHKYETIQPRPADKEVEAVHDKLLQVSHLIYGEELSALEEDLIQIIRAATQQTQGWMGIESAPRDGKIIIAYAIVDTETGNWNQYLISWNRYENEWNGWQKYTAAPTHWQPLPPPPSIEPEDKA